jgi:hypothetical protein
VVLALLAHESRHHFDPRLIQLKRQDNSAQANWNLFYGQRFVYYDSSFRYQADMDQIIELIRPGRVLLSDLATSYYAAASLPVYVKNVQRHHGRWQSLQWRNLFEDELACNLHDEEISLAFKEFVYADRSFSETKGLPKFEYLLLNKDQHNKNVRLDCIWNSRAAFAASLEKFSTLIYEGEYLSLYKVNESLSTAPSQGN